jgi:hypothetical protein
MRVGGVNLHQIARARWDITVCNDTNVPGAIIVTAQERNVDKPRYLCNVKLLTLADLKAHPLTDANLEAVEVALQSDRCAHLGAIDTTIIEMQTLGFHLCPGKSL